MAVHTFSTRDTRPTDGEAVKAVKAYCDKNKLNFSAIIVDLVHQYKKEKVDGQARG